MSSWTTQQSEELYNVFNWGGGYFRINSDGNLDLLPTCPDDPSDGDVPAIDLLRLVESLKQRGLELPILLRFDDVLSSRAQQIAQAFENARNEYGLEAPYVGVYPIKVNQQRHVVEALLDRGGGNIGGLEVGSKPELIAAIALLSQRSGLLLCNGYKDREYVETAMLASKLGIDALIVIEKFTELSAVFNVHDRLGIRPRIGVRIKLSGRGAGRWMESGGDRSKFGLTAAQIVKLVHELKARDMLDCFELLHFHLGSQMTHIRSLKAALREATRTLTGLAEMGAKVRYFDVGGGLGVDYDGSRSDFDSSRNYSIQEYANDVVFHLVEACREADIAAPAVVTESGRALTAHHSLLVTDVIGVSDFSSQEAARDLPDGAPETLRYLRDLSESVTSENYQEAYHDALQLREETLTLFNVGQVDLETRALCEEFYWRTCNAILVETRKLEYVPDDLKDLERDMADMAYINCSIFQSMPDSWAIHQLFPVVPIHRHNEEPTRRAILGDITCDSDGKIDRFIGMHGVKHTLELHHKEPGKPYYLAFCLIGAYQEILGDIHNLLGDTNAVHVGLGDTGKPRISHVVRGDRVKEVLSYMAYDDRELQNNVRRRIEAAIEQDRISFEDAAALMAHYEQGLRGYTYLRENALSLPAGNITKNNPIKETK